MVKQKNKEITYFGEIYGLSKTAWNGLQVEWRKKLKDSGFKDIEKYDGRLHQTSTIFLDNVFRNMPTQTDNSTEHIKQRIDQTVAFYRALGLIIHNTDLVPNRFKEAASLLSEGKGYPEIIRRLKNKTEVYMFKTMFSSRAFQKKVWEAVRKLDEEALND